MSRGRSRRTDPSTSHKAARSVDTTSIKFAILRELHARKGPLNGWELSICLEMTTITCVPRLAPMRRDGWIVQEGTRPGPTGRQQLAYIITDIGKKALDGMTGGPVMPIAPIDYARSVWPRGFTKPELVEAIHQSVRLEDLVKQKAIQDTGIRRDKHVVYRFRPFQLDLPLGKQD